MKARACFSISAQRVIVHAGGQRVSHRYGDGAGKHRCD